MREAGDGPVGVGGGGGRGDVVEGLDVGDLERFLLEFGPGGEGADELGRARGLQGAEGGVDGVQVGGWGARVCGPVQVDDAGGVGVREDGVLLGFAWMRCRFPAVWLTVDFVAGGGGSGFWSSGHRLELSLQPLPGSEGHVAVEAVGEVLHRDDALVQDRDLVVRFHARHAVRGEAFAQLLLNHRHVLGIVHGIAGQEAVGGV